MHVRRYYTRQKIENILICEVKFFSAMCSIDLTPVSFVILSNMREVGNSARADSVFMAYPLNSCLYTPLHLSLYVLIVRELFLQSNVLLQYLLMAWELHLNNINFVLYKICINCLVKILITKYTEAFAVFQTFLETCYFLDYCRCPLQIRNLPHVVGMRIEYTLIIWFHELIGCGSCLTYFF